jgi:glycosyltransferase involved in cell wall biosynthesis
VSKPSDLDRLVVISDQSIPIGGAEIMALLSATAAADMNVPITFIAGDTAEHCPLKPTSVEIIALNGSPIKGSFREHGIVGLSNPSARALIENFIATRDTPRTVYHLHNWSKILSPSVFQALRPVSSRLFISAHDFSLVCPNVVYTNYQKGGCACPLTPLSAACIFTNCDRISYLHKIWRVTRSIKRRLAINFSETGALVGIIHPDMAEYFLRAGVPRERLRVVRNPVRPFTKERVKAEANSDLFFIGRIVHEKGIDLAAEAARLTGRRLRVIGDGEIKSELAQQYPEVVFEGWLTHEQIGPLITEARGLIVSSRLPETFTLAAHEAMLSGIPVVAFSDVDCQEAAAIGGAIVVPPREAASLAEGLRLLDDDDTVERISRIAFEQGSRFSNTTETWMNALFKHYSDLICGDRDAPIVVKRRRATEAAR